MRSCAASRGGVVALAGLTLAVCAGAASARPHERPAADVTKYVAQLRAAAAQAEAAASATGGLVAGNTRRCAQVEPAARRLASAADAGQAVFERYRSAQTRYGTQEEIMLITTIALKLREARAGLASTAGEASAVPAAERQAAAREVSLFQQVIAREMEDRLGIEGLAEALTTQGFRGVKNQVVRELHKRVRVRAEAELRRLSGLRIRLDVPLRQQIRDFMASELSRLMSKLVVSAGPGGILVSLVAGRLVNPGKLVDIAAAALKRLLRQRGNVTARSNASLAGLERLRRSLNALPPDARLDAVRSVVRDARRELGRTKFLEGDLARARQTALLAELRAAKMRLEQTVNRTQFRFLLDSRLMGDDFGLGVAFAAKTRAETERLAKKLGCSLLATTPPPSGALGQPTKAVCVPGSFRMTVTGGDYAVQFLDLVKTHTFGAKCLWVDDRKIESFVAFIDFTPAGTPGAIASGDCARSWPDNPPYYRSRKRYLTVSGGNRKLGQTAVGGNERVLKQVLAAAEAAGVGKACP